MMSVGSSNRSQEDSNNSQESIFGNYKFPKMPIEEEEAAKKQQANKNAVLNQNVTEQK